MLEIMSFVEAKETLKTGKGMRFACFRVTQTSNSGVRLWQACHVVDVYFSGEIMNALIQGIKKFQQEEDGVTAIEYSLIAALIAVVIIAAVTSVGVNLNALFSYVAGQLANA
jgi:pilus assembly protein Flp/PilA